MRFIVYLLLLAVLVVAQKPKKKDLTSYTDADLERLFDEWEENEEEKWDDGKVDDNKQDLDSMKAKAKNPEELLMMSKKGQNLMMFVGIVDPSVPLRKDIRQFSEKWTAMWQSQLHNNHIEIQVFLIDDNRAIFMFSDGSQAGEAKNFLLKQEYVSEVTIEGQMFEGPAAKLLEKQEL